MKLINAYNYIPEIRISAYAGIAYSHTCIYVYHATVACPPPPPLPFSLPPSSSFLPPSSSSSSSLLLLLLLLLPPPPFSLLPLPSLFLFLFCSSCYLLSSPSSSDNTYIEVLDSTRVHPETYEWARKMAVDALEYDEVNVLSTKYGFGPS